MATIVETGQLVTIPKGTTLNNGLHEDSDSLELVTDVSARVVNGGQRGGVEVVVPGHEDLSPLFWHQPEETKRSS